MIITIFMVRFQVLKSDSAETIAKLTGQLERSKEEVTRLEDSLSSLTNRLADNLGDDAEILIDELQSQMDQNKRLFNEMDTVRTANSGNLEKIKVKNALLQCGMTNY